LCVFQQGNAHLAVSIYIACFTALAQKITFLLVIVIFTNKEGWSKGVGCYTGKD